MKVSAKAEYACLALITLAQRSPEERPLQVRAIAEAQCIPQPMLTQIMAALRAAGLVQSVTGKNGGYRLARPPDKIKLEDVVHLIDGENGKRRRTQGTAGAILDAVWQRIVDLEREVLADVSIAQLAGDVPSQDWVI